MHLLLDDDVAVALDVAVDDRSAGDSRAFPCVQAPKDRRLFPYGDRCRTDVPVQPAPRPDGHPLRHREGLHVEDGAGRDHQRRLRADLVVAEEFLEDGIQVLLLLDTEDGHEIHHDVDDDRHRVTDGYPAFRLEPALDLDVVSDIEVASDDELAPDLHPLAEVGVLLCDDVAADLAPVVYPDVAARDDGAVDLAEFTDHDVVSRKAVIDPAPVTDDDILRGLERPLLELGVVREGAALDPVVVASLFHLFGMIFMRHTYDSY